MKKKILLFIYFVLAIMLFSIGYFDITIDRYLMPYLAAFVLVGGIAYYLRRRLR
jgi:hypothetical protein